MGTFWLIVRSGFIEISIHLNRFVCTAMALNAAEKTCVCYSNQIGPFNKFVGVFLLSSPDFKSECFFGPLFQIKRFPKLWKLYLLSH